MICGRPAVLCYAAAAIFLFAIPSFSQTSTSDSADDERYTVKSSIEIGARWVDVDGDENKFRSDLNYRRGIRLFDSSITIDDNSKTGFKLFDSAMLIGSGWGADPSGYFRANIERNSIYRFDANVRRVIYFNNLSNHAIGNDRINLHNADRQRNLGDFDLTFLPDNPNIRFRMGYSYNVAEGKGSTSTRISRGDAFPAFTDVDSRAHDFRAGADGKFLGFNFSGTYGFRSYEERTQYSLTDHPGDVTTNTIFIQSMERRVPIDGLTHFGVFSAQRTFAEKFDFTAKVVHSSSQNDSNFLELVRYISSTNVPTTDQYDVIGDNKRVQTRADLGLTWRITDRFRISNTFNYDGFNINGGTYYNQVVTPGATTRTQNYASTRYRRYTNTLEGDYQVNNRLAFNLGWRYTHREVTLGSISWPLGGAMGVFHPEEAENSTNTVIAGTQIKPTKNWTIWADVEAGKADNVFTRLANYKFANFRVRNRAHFGKFAFNASFITKDNDNPGQSVTTPTSAFVTEIRSRVFSSSVDWNPVDQVQLSAGYDYHWLTSEVSVLIPLGGPATPGLSQYFVRDNYFFVDGYFRPIKRFTLFGSYRWNKDRGHGDRTVPPLTSSLILSSYPIDFKTPEVRASIRLTRHIDWNVGYQYYDYQEETPQQIQYLLPVQNYRAHLPYTSVTIYFGKGKSDRW